jgi:hypothetical protein
VTNRILIHLPIKHNQLAVKVGFEVDLFSADNLLEDGWKNLELQGKTEYFPQLAAGLIDLDEKYLAFHHLAKPEKFLIVKKEKLVFEDYFQTNADSVNLLYSQRFLETLSIIIIGGCFLSIQPGRLVPQVNSIKKAAPTE